MENLLINVEIDGQSYLQGQLDYIQFEREKHVLQEMIYLGAKVKDGEKLLSYDDINYLDPTSAKRISIANRSQMSYEETIDLYSEQVKRSNDLWKNIAEEFQKNQEYNTAFAYMEVEGITIQELREAIGSAVGGADTASYAANPEHFAHGGGASEQKNKKHGIETMGMYGGPIDMNIIFDSTITGPAIEEDGFINMISGTSELLDGTNRGDVAVHQIKPTENGFKLKMFVYFPSATPETLVKGHQIHLAIEFSEAVKAAYALKQSK